MIFVDTGAWFALLVPGDVHHAAVRQWYDACDEELVTTDYCVDELLTLLVTRKHASLAVSSGWKLFQEELSDLHFRHSRSKPPRLDSVSAASGGGVELYRLHEQDRDR